MASTVAAAAPAAKDDKKLDKTRVFVGNLAFKTTSEELRAHIAAVVPDVVSAEIIAYNNSGRSKGCGLASFKSPADADKAIKQLTNTELGGRKIFVREDREETGFGGGANGAPRSAAPRTSGGGGGSGGAGAQGKSAPAPRQPPAAAGGAGAGASAGQGGAGAGTGARRRRRGGRGGGAGGATGGAGAPATGGAPAAGAARQGGAPGSSSGAGAGGAGRGAGGRPPRKDDGERADLKRPPNTNPANLYVGNLPWTTSDEDLRALFATYGAVTKAQIAMYRSGRSKGFGTVSFANPAHASAAIAALHDTEYQTRKLVVRMDSFADA